MLNGVYVANVDYVRVITKGKMYKFINGSFKDDQGKASPIKYEEAEPYFRPIKPKEILERLDTVEVEVIKPWNEHHAKQYILLGDVFRPDASSNWFSLESLNEDLEGFNVRINKITDKNGNVKWEREPKNHEVGKSIDEIERKLEELKAELDVLKTKL